MTTTEPFVLSERRGHVGVVTLNNPKRSNLLDAPTVAAIDAAFDGLEGDDRVTCIVLTGAGRSFCAGADLGVLESAIEGDFGSVQAVYDGFLRVLASPLPVIGAINGAAVGAGFNLALACDIRIAGSSARFDTRFARLHIHPGGGHTWLLTRAVGAERAMRACLFGETWTAAEALQVGLVSEVADDAELVDRAVGFAGALADQSPAFVRRLTASLRAAATPITHAQALAGETEAQRWSVGEPEFAAGLAAIRATIAAGRRESGSR